MPWIESTAFCAPLQPWDPTSTWIWVARALPSADSIGPDIRPGKAPGTPANLLASADALTLSAGVMPESRTYTMTPEKTSGDWKRDCTFRTLVDSALAG